MKKIFIVFLAIVFAIAPVIPAAKADITTSSSADSSASSSANSSSALDFKFTSTIENTNKQSQWEAQYQKQIATGGKASATGGSATGVGSVVTGDVNITNPREFNNAPNVMQQQAMYPGQWNTFPRYNQLTSQGMAMVSCYTTEKHNSVVRHLSKKDRKVAEDMEKFVNESIFIMSAQSRSSFAKYMGNNTPPGVEGVDYILLAEIKISAEKLDVQSSLFKYMIAFKALALGGNAYSFPDFGSDPEQKTGGWSFGLSVNNSVVSGSAGSSAATGFGVGRGFHKEMARGWLLGYVYYVFPTSQYAQWVLAPCVPVAPVITPVMDCSEYDRIINDLLDRRHRCKDWCYNNMRLNLELGDAYSDKGRCTGQLEYFVEAERAYARAIANYEKGRDIRQYRDSEEIRIKVFHHWTYAAFKSRGEHAAWEVARQGGSAVVQMGIITDIR